jgi:oligopeptide/dipeptide ABC transporter ATP-binding protein
MAIAHNPKVLIADEPTTALDVTIQAQILALLKSLQKTFGMAVLFITHDLGVVAEIADRVVVMYAGGKVEEATVEDLFDNPRHPYTQGLLRATISADQDRTQRLAPIDGVVPNLDAFPAGCAFANRCPQAFARCSASRPSLKEGPRGHRVACFASEREGRADVALVSA